MEPADGHPTIQHCIRSFEPYLAANRRTEKPVIHISLNPHPDDVLTDEQLTAIGQEYMEKMGYGNQPYIIYRHEDIGRPHIHIVSLRIDEQGKKIKDYKEMATLDRCLPGAGEEIPSVTRREDGATGIPAADCRRLPEGGYQASDSQCGQARHAGIQVPIRQGV